MQATSLLIEQLLADGLFISARATAGATSCESFSRSSTRELANSDKLKGSRVRSHAIKGKCGGKEKLCPSSPRRLLSVTSAVIADMKLLLKNAIVAGAALLAGVFAGRLSEVSRRKGFTEDMIRNRLDSRSMEERAVNTSEYRFYNNNTKKYFVESLPEIPQSFMTEMYAGLIPIDKKNASRALYYVFTPTVGKPVDTLTIWLNGGPGCSSLEGFFQENGRII